MISRLTWESHDSEFQIRKCSSYPVNHVYPVSSLLYDVVFWIIIDWATVEIFSQSTVKSLFRVIRLFRGSRAASVSKSGNDFNELFQFCHVDSAFYFTETYFTDKENKSTKIQAFQKVRIQSSDWSSTLKVIPSEGTISMFTVSPSGTPLICSWIWPWIL